jgi:hypothetical protein
MSPLEITILVAALLASAAYYIRERRRARYDPGSADLGPGFPDGDGSDCHHGHDSHCGDHGADAGGDCGGHDGGSH